MKRHAVVLALGLVNVTCAQHPAYTVGIATGTIGFGGCAIDEVKIGDCAAIGALTGVFFGALTALLYHYTDSSAHELKMDESLGSGGAVELHTFTLPPPVPLDAGVALPEVVPTAVDAGVAPIAVPIDSFDQPAS